MTHAAGGRGGTSGRAGRGAAPARGAHARCLAAPAPSPPTSPSSPSPPPLHPRLAPSLLARRVLKLGGWQQTSSARGLSSSALCPLTHQFAAHTTRQMEIKP